MRALLVNPLFQDAYWSAKHSLPFVDRKCVLPPLGLITVAALLPPSWEYRLVDQNVEELSDEQLRWADVVLLTGMLAQRPSLQGVLSRCRDLKTPTVVGGPHATTSPEDLELADHIVQGEAEHVAPVLAAALESDTAGRVYREEGKPDLAATPVPRYDLLPPRAYHELSLQFSRGCPFGCEFCDITERYGRRPRVKTPPQVIAELEAIRATGFAGDVFFVDDNFIGARKAVRQVLPRIAHWRRATRAPLGFYTEASMDLADDDSLVKSMVDAGFTAVFLGVETPNPEALRETGKLQNLAGDALERIHSLLARGLDVWGGFILGFDSDGPDIFDRMIAFVQKSAMPYAMVGLLGAIPGTALFRRLQRERRLRPLSVAERGDQFGLTNVVTKLPVRQLLEGYHRVLATLYDPDNYFERCRRNLARWKLPTERLRRLSLTDLRAGWRAFCAQGLRGPYRRAYWRFLTWAATHHPRKVVQALTQAAVGHHFITYTCQTVLPALERSRAGATDASLT